MFQFHKIKLTNFRSYRGTHEFEFPTTPGIYFITGLNLVDDLGANGAGKSTFIDAIVWCLYGNTARGLKANDVLCDWEIADCQVELDLTIGDQYSTIKRTQKPNNLMLDGRLIDQTELEAYIRLNFASFTNSVLHPQFGESFFNLNSSTKLNLFSSIMNLNYWLDLSKHAAKQSEALVEEIERIQRKIDNHNGQIKVVQADITNLMEEEFDYTSNHKGRISNLRKQEAAILKEKVTLANDCILMKDEKKKFIAKITDLTFNLHAAEKHRDELITSIQEFSANKEALTARLVRANKELDGFAGINKQCPTCKRVMDAIHLGLMKANLTKEIESIPFRIEVMESNRHQALEALIKAKAKCESIIDDITETNDRKINAEVEIGKTETKQEAADAQLKSIRARLKDLEREINPYTTMISEKNTRLMDLKSALSNHKKAHIDFEIENVATSFWVKGFKRIRLYVIEQAFQDLEIEVNNSLAMLGLQNWEITFDIERENKSGGMTKGFMVFVKSPHNKEPVKWENWSGGETQRLQLAGDLGLANLIMQQQGLVNTIEFYDEFSIHLSQEGVQDVLRLLHERAMLDEKVIIVVDHNSHNFAEFAGTIVVTKDQNGSRIAYGS